MQHKLLSPVQKYCDLYKNILLKKKIGLFICHLAFDRQEEEFSRAFPQSLRYHASALGYFGGELLFDKMNLIERLLTKKLYAEKKDVHKLNLGEIIRFAGVMNQEI